VSVCIVFGWRMTETFKICCRGEPPYLCFGTRALSKVEAHSRRCPTDDPVTIARCLTHWVRKLQSVRGYGAHRDSDALAAAAWQSRPIKTVERSRASCGRHEEAMAFHTVATKFG
jgi:hypothetical protein